MPTLPLDNGRVDAFARHLATEFGLADLALYYRPARGELHLSMIRVAPERRSQGVGTQVMKRLLAFADVHGQRLTLSPSDRDSAVGTTSKARLVRFYKRFGFVENKGRHKDYTLSETMHREPGPKPSIRPEPEVSGPGL